MKALHSQMCNFAATASDQNKDLEALIGRLGSHRCSSGSFRTHITLFENI
uniref:Alternative protein C11orf34 n=1 Tax=Homo sapiens TaxID=9606 RepID=L0R4U8_HUMAN|nr:alternative protein C11orf34 [Homo sapiens]